MGLLRWLGYDAVSTLAAEAATRGVVSPWTGPSGLTKIVATDLFGTQLEGVTREEAMSLPAVAKARHLICGTLARQPLVAMQDGVRLESQPTWLYRTDTQVSPRLRTLWVLDDLFFYGWSLLGVSRGADGQILDAARIPKARWRFDSNGLVMVDDKPVSSEQVVLIPGLGDGFLTEAARTVRGARKTEEQWVARVKNPIPTVEIRYTGEEDLTPEEMREIRDSYVAARADDNGVVMVTPRGFEIHAHGDQALELFVAGRNAASLDVARFANVPGSVLDASQVNGSSVDYENNGVGRSSFYDLTLRTWALPLEERLSLDDCVPRGTYVQFDLSGLTTTPDDGTGPVLQD